MELSYCVVNTNGRELLLTCLEAIRRTHPAGIEHEVLVLDNASDDGSAEAVARALSGGPADRPRPPRRAGREQLAAPARGPRALLPAAERGLRDPRGRRRGAARGARAPIREAAAAGAQLLDPDGNPIPCAWRLPGLGHGARPGAVPAPLAGHPERRPPEATAARGRLGAVVRRCSCGARPRRRSATWTPTSSSTRRRSTSRSGCSDAGWRILHVPAARAIHHEQLATDRSAGARRVVQFHRGRDDVHAQAPLAPGRLRARVLWAWSYVPRAIAARVHARTRRPAGTGSTPARRCAPRRGEGMREAAEAYNLQLAAERGTGAPTGQVAGPVLVAGDGLVDLGAEPGAVSGRALGAAGAGAARRLRARAAIADGRSIAARPRALLLVEEPDREQGRG